MGTEPWVGLGGMAHSGDQGEGHWWRGQGDRARDSPTSPLTAPPPPPNPEQDSPVNKLLYAREIPRYKQMVER